MKQRESIFQLTSTAFYYATTPLRFSFDCFELRYSNEVVEQIFEALKREMLPPTQSFGESLVRLLFLSVIVPVIFLATSLLSMPYIIGELALGLFAIIPAIAIAIAALPVMALLALGEFICNFNSNSNKNQKETHAFKPAPKEAVVNFLTPDIKSVKNLNKTSRDLNEVNESLKDKSPDIKNNKDKNFRLFFQPREKNPPSDFEQEDIPLRIF